jgi:hypothetical protein
MRLRTIWAVLVSIHLLYSCKNEEDRLRDQAELLCKIDLSDSTNLYALPDSFDPSQNIRGEDIAYLRKKNTRYDSGDALGSGLISMKKVMTEARTKRTKCDVGSVEMRESSATVRMQCTAPKLEFDTLTVLREVGSVKDHDEQVEKADSLLAKGAPITKKHEINFVKTQTGWLADLQFPERAAQEQAAAERNKKFEKAKTDAQELIQWYEWDEAKEKLLEAQKIVPGDTDIIEMIKKIDEALKTRIAGKWYEQKDPDAAADKQNVYVKLRASANINARYFRELPTLVARCVNGQLELLIVVNEVIDRSIWGTDEVDTAKVSPAKAGPAKAGTAKAGTTKAGTAKVSTAKIEPAKVQYHFGEQPPESLVVNPSTDRQTLFFPDAKKWMARLVQKASDSLVIEIPLLDEGPKSVTFKLEGADKAIDKVLNACSK